MLRQQSRRAAARIAIAVAALVGFGVDVAVPAGAATSPTSLAGGKGRVDYHLYGTIDGLKNDYLVYTPAGWKSSDNLPLYVALHGCAMTGADMMAATWLNPIADRERFIVAYPDNGGGCWRAVSDDAILGTVLGTPNITRGAGGDVDIVAGITKQIISKYNVNKDRVYLAGGSAGAFQTSATATAYPELYAAVGLVAGPGPGMAVTCAGYPAAVIPGYAKWAVKTMGQRARLTGFFVLSGTADPLGAPGNAGGCSRLGYLEWLYINNLLKPSPSAPAPGACGLLPPVGYVQAANVCADTFLTNSFATKHGKVPGGYKWTRKVAEDWRSRCQIGEEWVVHGMGHTWPGGSGDVEMQGDPRGPSASELSWKFFKQFSLKDGNTNCRVW